MVSVVQNFHVYSGLRGAPDIAVEQHEYHMATRDLYRREQNQFQSQPHQQKLTIGNTKRFAHNCTNRHSHPKFNESNRPTSTCNRKNRIKQEPITYATFEASNTQ